MHTVAARTDRELLPTAVAALLDRHDQRRADRAQPGSSTPPKPAREAAYQRFTETSQQAAQRVQRHRSRSQDQGYGLEL